MTAAIEWFAAADACPQQVCGRWGNWPGSRSRIGTLRITSVSRAVFRREIIQSMKSRKIDSVRIGDNG